MTMCPTRQGSALSSRFCFPTTLCIPHDRDKFKRVNFCNANLIKLAKEHVKKNTGCTLNCPTNGLKWPGGMKFLRYNKVEAYVYFPSHFLLHRPMHNLHKFKHLTN